MTGTATRRTYASDGIGTGDVLPTSRWKSRPVAAAACRIAIALAPVVVASALTVTVQVFWLAGALARRGLPLHVLAYGCLAAATLAVTVLAERLARRALPLVALLRLSMLFTDQAPSRFQMARTAGNPAALRRLAARSDEQGAAAAQVLALLSQLTEHERRTRGHSERVRVYADLMAEQLGLNEDERMRLRLAAVVHDIGKLSVPAEVLVKAGRPTPEEWDTLRGHPEAGIELAGPVRDWLGPWSGAINEHHERYDGRGYPRGLAGTEISLAGRIVAVADAFETMTSNRSYKKPMSVTAARKELTDCAGTHFDPTVVRAFTELSLPRLCRRTLAAGILVNLPVIGSLQAGAAQLAGAVAPIGSGSVAGLAGGVPAGAAAMTVLASSVAMGVVPPTAAVGPPAPPATVSVAQHSAPAGPGSAGGRRSSSLPAQPASHPASGHVTSTKPSPGSPAHGLVWPTLSVPTTSAPHKAAPGKPTPGKGAPGKGAPVRSGPDLFWLRTIAPGKAAPGETAPGKTAPGKAVPGKAVPGKGKPGAGKVAPPPPAGHPMAVLRPLPRPLPPQPVHRGH